jgi:hypothetical protein
MKVRLIAGVALVTTCSCAEPEAAPAELDALARFFFQKVRPAEGAAPSLSDVELQDGFGKLHDVLDGDALSSTEPQRGTLESLTQQELDTVGVDGDPTRGQGMFIANVVHCSMTQMKEITLEPNQLSLYPEAYAAYSRTVDDEAPPYLPGWTATFTSTENALLSNQFTATSRSSLRLVPDSEDARFGAVMVRAGFFPEPAVFESEGSEFSVDFQVETWHPRGDDEVVHFYGMWRYMKLGILGDSYEQTFIDQTLQGMIDWDTKTDTLCAGG